MRLQSNGLLVFAGQGQVPHRHLFAIRNPHLVLISSTVQVGQLHRALPISFHSLPAPRGIRLDAITTQRWPVSTIW